jgi:hypothetical protein
VAAGSIGTLSAQITANAQGLFAALDAGERRMQRFGDIAKSALGSLGVGLSAAGLGAAIKSSIDDAGRLVDVSSKLGIGVGALEQLELAARTSGIQAEALHTGIGKLEQKIGEAARGSAEARADFTAMGLSWQELASMSPDEAFARVAQEIGSMGTAFERADAATNIFGKSGRELIPLMRDFQGSMDAAGGSLTKLSEEGAQKLDELGDAWERLKARTASFGRQVIINNLQFIEAIGRGVAWLTTGGRAPLGQPPAAPQMTEAAKAAEQSLKLQRFQLEQMNKEATAFTDTWQKWADRMAEDAKDPLQKLAEQIDNLKFAFQEGFLTEAAFRRAMAKAEEMGRPKEDLAEDKAEKAAKLFQRPDLLGREVGSVEAGNAIVRFLNQGRSGLVDAEAERQQKLLQLTGKIAGGVAALAEAWGVADVGQ